MALLSSPGLLLEDEEGAEPRPKPMPKLMPSPTSWFLIPVGADPAVVKQYDNKVIIQRISVRQDVLKTDMERIENESLKAAVHGDVIVSITRDLHSNLVILLST